ncbi:sensor histidine kinase [Flavobacterium sp. NRK F7]|uniref:sensor histidine kinase n=1 Tax=Flavobacterium sp. NRK F7 TaxID=2954930 RepID=UPI0020903530|nr:sensor histidine kinase [Flavobacterium sp. NRK F7]MCO6162058.1 sensor histidine kinase [Flavobacterium sp. NRK F7]
MYGQKDYNTTIDRYVSQFQYDSASYFTQKGIKENKEDNHLKASYYIRYAQILKSLSKADSCFYFLDKAENYFKKVNNRNELFHILTIRAEVSRYLVKQNLANSYIYEAEKLFNENTNLHYKYYYLNRRMAILAEYYNTTPDSLTKVKEIGHEILENATEIKDKSIIVYTLNEIGYLDFNRNPENALPYFLKAYAIAKEYDVKIAFIDVCINLGRFYQQKDNDITTAKKFYKEAVNQAKIINNLWQIQQCYNELKNINTLDNNFKEAMFYGDSLNEINSKISFYSSNKRYELLENKIIIEFNEKQLKASKKNIYYLITVLLISLLGVFILIFYSKKIQHKNKLLEKLSEENEFLISETNHRVNNNLQLITLLIADTLRKKEKEEHRNDFLRILSKIETIASLHRHLYKNKNKNEIALKDYLTEIKNNFNEIAEDKNVALTFTIDDFKIESENAMYLGLLITELIINSIKYAFTATQEKIITTSITKETQGYSFNYQDNGKTSINENIKPKLIHQLCLQLDVNYTINTSNGFQLSFVKK